MFVAEKYISRLIQQGEHDQLDFKFEISDSKKIARSIAAFANTNGGRLLIGVKDNGQIAGVRSDEEFYMIEAAANMYCNPPVSFNNNEWHINGKTILEIIIHPSMLKPHSAPNKDGKYKVYIRVNDQNLLANNVLLKVWHREKHHISTFLSLYQPEKILLDYLSNKQSITKSMLCKVANINSFIAEKILINLTSTGILKMRFTEKAVYYSLRKEDEPLLITSDRRSSSH